MTELDRRSQSKFSRLRSLLICSVCNVYSGTKAASALNHPHILTIYEVGSLEDSRYIVTEFIDGGTLRQRVRAGMKLSGILEVAIETTSAAAHAAGIIHQRHQAGKHNRCAAMVT